MNKRQFFLGMFVAAFLGALLALGGFSYLVKQQPPAEPSAQTTNFKFSKNYLTDSIAVVPEGLNFIYAAEKVRPAVVYIKTTYGDKVSQGEEGGEQLDDLFRDFFGDQGGQRRNFHSPAKASGSGVILSQDGYIISNNHVIQDAEKIEVILDDKRRYYGKVIGTDPTTDLALIKIEEKGLPFVNFGNSDNLRVGEWVLAIGNPFNLTSTVTAGIVSALSRNINIIQDKDGKQVEAFIQTDAAVNPGNSGGALVDLKGNLVGINTAILGGASGSYTGYSFAVPSTLAKKVMDDLLKFGDVQRGLMGVQIKDIDPDFAEKNNLGRNDGVYVSDVPSEGAAKGAGIKTGDIIVKIDDRTIHTVSELQQNIAVRRPGDKVKVTFIRDGKEKEVSVTLKSAKSNPLLVKKSLSASKIGAELSEISDKEKEKLNLEYGVKVEKIENGIFEEAGIKEGLIITKVNKRSVKTAKEVQYIIANTSGGILIEGLYPNGEEGMYLLKAK